MVASETLSKFAYKSQPVIRWVDENGELTPAGSTLPPTEQIEVIEFYRAILRLLSTTPSTNTQSASSEVAGKVAFEGYKEARRQIPRYNGERKSATIREFTEKMGRVLVLGEQLNAWGSTADQVRDVAAFLTGTAHNWYLPRKTEWEKCNASTFLTALEREFLPTNLCAI